MSFTDFLARILTHLEDAGIPYMVAGSLGSTLYGEPRATNDVDIVILPEARQLRAFLDALGTEYYVSAAAALQAMQAHSMFNVVDLQTGWKADLIVRKNRPFSVEEFSRRTRLTVQGIPAWVATPEDVILSKLEWAQLGSSERQLRDALGVALACYQSLQQDYLEKWAAELGVVDELRTLLEETRRHVTPQQGELFP